MIYYATIYFNTEKIYFPSNSALFDTKEISIIEEKYRKRKRPRKDITTTASAFYVTLGTNLIRNENIRTNKKEPLAHNETFRARL